MSDFSAREGRKMKILLLEDQGTVSYYLQEALEKKGHDVLHALTINDALSYWEEENIDCLIVDLNMISYGLKPKEIKQTLDGVLTGWIWLHNYIFIKNPSMRYQTIIYTEFISEFKENVSEKEREGIYVIPKRGAKEPVKQLMQFVEAIAKKVAKTRGS